jgi:hypothetical protein
MASRYVSVTFNDLSSEAQSDLIEQVKESLVEQYKTEGEEILKATRFYVSPKTWQEAYCRQYSVDWKLWDGLDEKGEEFQTYDWTYALDQYAEEQAQLKLVTAFKYVELEVEL